MFIFVLVTLGAFAQNTDSKEDSLLQLLNSGKGDKVEILYELFKNNRLSNLSLASDYALEAYNESVNLKDSIWIVKNGRAAGWCYKELGYNSVAMDYYKSALLIANKNIKRVGYRDQVKYLLNDIGSANIKFGDYDKALEYYLESLKLREEDGDSVDIAISYNNVGLVYHNVGDYEKSRDYYLKALEINNKLGEQEKKDKNLVNIGHNYVALKEYNKALDYFSRGLSFCKDHCDDKIIMWANHGIGTALYRRGNYDSAKMHLAISNDYARKTHSLRYISLNNYYLATVSYEKEEYSKALMLLDEGIVIADDLSLTSNLVEYYDIYANVYSAKGDYKQAYKYLNESVILKDSIFGQEMIKNLANLQLDYQDEKNKELIKAKNDQIETSKKLNYLLALFVALFSAFLIVLYVNFRQKQKNNKQLAEANGIIEDQNIRLTEMNTILDNKVKERTHELKDSNLALQQSNKELDTFIYRTSHDIRGPLASLLGLSEVAMIDVQDDKALDYFGKLNYTAKNLNQILSRVLDITQIKTSSQFEEDIDFNSIIEDVKEKQSNYIHFDQIAFSYSVEEELNFQCDPYLIQTILNNLIDNSYKFYNSSNRVESFVNVEVVKTEEVVLIKVIDNGIGINGSDTNRIFEIFSKASELSETAGLGLYLVKLAVERLRGKVYLAKNEEGYTQFDVTLPLKTDLKVIPAA